MEHTYAQPYKSTGRQAATVSQHTHHHDRIKTPSQPAASDIA